MRAAGIAVAVFVLLLAVLGRAHARDDGQWGNSPATVREWFRSLMQPDQPYQSCCGEADAFEADSFEIEGDHYVAIITDGKGILPSGTRIPVPNRKMKWDAGNPTGHGIIFLSGVVGIRADQNYVYVLIEGEQGRILYCYVAPGGV